jgi:hypothetical protein
MRCCRRYASRRIRQRNLIHRGRSRNRCSSATRNPFPHVGLVTRCDHRGWNCRRVAVCQLGQEGRGCFRRYNGRGSNRSSESRAEIGRVVHSRAVGADDDQRRPFRIRRRISRARARRLGRATMHGAQRFNGTRRHLRAVLQLWRRTQRKVWLKRGMSLLEWVFPSSAGSPLDPANVRKVLKRIIDKAQLKHRNVHSLRHTFASLLLQLQRCRVVN